MSTGRKSKKEQYVFSFLFFICLFILNGIYELHVLIAVLQAMHKGVERDVEKQRVRQEREAEFAMQRALEDQYLKIQNVSPSTDGQVGGAK